MVIKSTTQSELLLSVSLALLLTLSLGCTTCDCCRDRVFVPELTPNLEQIDGWQPVGGCCEEHKSCVKYKSPDGVNTITRHTTRTGFQYETSTLLSTSGKPNKGKSDTCSHADLVVPPTLVLERLCKEPETDYGTIIYN